MGVAFGVLLAFVDVGRATVLPGLGYPTPWIPFPSEVGLLSGGGSLVAHWMIWGVTAVQFSLLTILIVVVLRLVCRWPWLAFALTSVFLSVSTWQNMTSSTSWLWAIAVVSGALLTFVAVRFGLLTLVVTWFVWNVLYGTPMTLDFSHWSATASNWTLGLVAVLTVFGFSAARTGQPRLR
jgi:hypothetical protein